MVQKKTWKNCNRFSEKLGQRMLQLGLNGQKLARKSDVSDSEISRIMNGRSLPGLENAISLAKAVNVSLDFLADDLLEADPGIPKETTNELEAVILQLAREIGTIKAIHILQNTQFLGFDIAAHRLLEAKPIVAPMAEPTARPVVAPMPVAGRASTG